MEKIRNWNGISIICVFLIIYIFQSYFANWVCSVFFPYVQTILLSNSPVHRDLCPKFATGLKCSNRHRSKSSIWVTCLFFCQKWFTHGGIILAKEQTGHSCTFWSMPIWTFQPSHKFWATVTTNFISWY